MLDIENHRKLIEYLTERNIIPAGETPQCCNLYGGVSNKTVKVAFCKRDQIVLKQALEKLRVDADWFSDPERIHHEALGLKWLSALTRSGSVPEFIFEDRAEHILAMSAVPPPHQNLKELLLKDAPEHRHAILFADLIADIHLTSHEKQKSMPADLKDRKFFISLRLEPYYAFSADQQPEAASFLKNLIGRTMDRQLTIVHGDYSPKNILVTGNRLVLLDHEVIHFGDPTFDIGFAMAHFLSKAHFRTAQRDAFILFATTFWEHYFSRCSNAPWSENLQEYCISHTIACLLARAIGKSPLEYLDMEMRNRQMGVACMLLKMKIPDMNSLFTLFTELLNNHDHHKRSQGH